MSEPASTLRQPDLDESTLFDLLPVGILLLDDNGHVRSANPMAESLLGVRAGDMNDRLAIRAALDIVCRDSSQVQLRDLDLRQIAQQHVEGNSVEMALAKPDGSLAWLNLRATAVPGGLAITLENAGPRIHDTATLEAHTRLVEQANVLDLEDLLRAALDEIELLTCSGAAGYVLVAENQTDIVLQVASTQTDARSFFGDAPTAPRSIETVPGLADAVRKKNVVLRNEAPPMHVDPSGAGRELIVPVVCDDKVRALVAVRNKPFHYDDADVRVVERLANLSWELAALKLARRDAEQRANQICKVATSAPGLVCMLRLSPDGCFTLHHVVHVDDDFYGIPASELGTDTSRLVQRVHPDDSDGLAQAIATSARDLTLHHHRWRFQHPSKGIRWHEVWAIPQREADGGTLWHGFLMDVTAQVQAEAAAAKNAARVEQWFDQAAVGIVLTRPDLKVIKANQAFCSMIGYDPAELVGLDLLSVAHPDDRAPPTSTPEQLSGGARHKLERRYIHKDGRVLWAQIDLSLVHDDGGTPSHFVMQVQDITERKQMEEALRASEERFSHAFELAPALALLVRADDSTILDANQEFCRLTKFTSEELVGSSLGALGLVSEEEHRKNVQRMVREGQLRNHETVLRTKDGRLLDCLLSLEMFDLHGEKLLLAMATDISEHKRSQAALHENEERFRLLIEHAPAALALFDHDMRYLAVSQRWMDDYGLEGRDLLGKSHYEIFPEIGKDWKAIHRRALAGESIGNSEDRFERNDGSVQWLRWEVLPWHRADGTVGGIVIFSEDITAGKLAELESNTSRAKLAAALKSMSDAVFISDTEGHFIDCNDAFAKFHRFPNREACPREFSAYAEIRDLFLPSGELAPVAQWPVPRALRGESASNVEYIIRSKESGEAWVGSYSFAPIRDDGGAIVGSVVVGRDITLQKRASERFRQITEAAKEWVWEVDVDGLYTYSSPVVEQLLGYRPDELVGKRHYYDLWTDETRETLVPLAADTFRAKQSFANLPNTCLHKSGQRVLIETTGFPILGPGGELIGYRGADRDVTEREEALAALRESEVRFRELFEHSPVAVWEEDLSALATRFAELRDRGVTDLLAYLDEHPEQVSDLASRVRILEVNEASLKLFGAASPADLTKHLPKYFTDGSTAAFREEMAALYAGKTKFEAESPRQDVHGKALHLQLHLSVVPGHAHDLARVLVSFMDLTARKTAEAERRELEREVNHLQRLESLGRLASGVSHDMNNVLGAIMAIGSLLKARHKEDPALSKDAEALLHAATRGRDLVKGLRDFSRKELQSARQLDLNEVLRYEAELLERTSLKRVAIVLDLASSLPPVFGESASIQNALMNLCLNAMDAMPEKGTLKLSTRDLGQGFVELAVEDDGEGMSPDVLARAMEPFFTTKPIGKGTGLGLSQVYGTVKAHGGTLDIQSKPGAGTRVSLVFPSALAITDRLKTEARGLGNPERVLKILLVDDEEMIRGTVLSLLDVLGHQAQAASSGIEALRRLDADMEVDLVILDINMPGMDGVETLSRLRIARPELKVLFATGHADDRIPSILQRFPAVRILKKPFNITELERVLSDW